MRSLSFDKMHSNGNDFIVLDGLRQQINLSDKSIKYLANRNYGVGCDQILVVIPPKNIDSDFFCHIYNPDGGEADQCGNGMLCIGHWIHKRAISPKTSWRIQTRKSIVLVERSSKGSIKAHLAEPDFSPEATRFQLQDDSKPPYNIEYIGQKSLIYTVNVGNNHAIIEVDDPYKIPINEWGEALSNHERFQDKVNISFAQYESSNNKINLRIFERGAGETMACGSAAAASAAVGIKYRKFKSVVSVLMPGGILKAYWRNQDKAVCIEAQTNYIYEGSIVIS